VMGCARPRGRWSRLWLSEQGSIFELTALGYKAEVMRTSIGVQPHSRRETRLRRAFGDVTVGRANST
jgi:hypothetical protein